MKILFLTPWYPDDRNLQGIFIRDQAVAIAMVHDVFLISSKVDKTSFGLLSFETTESVFNNVHEHRLRIKRSIPVYNQFNYFMITAWHTWRTARHFKPDLIHGNIGYPGAFWAWIASKLFKVPYVMTEHSTRYENHLRSPVHRLLAVAFMKRASKIIAVSANSAADIFSHVKRQPIVVPNVIVIENFKNLKTASDNSTCHLGFLGGLDYPRKGLDILLKAMARIPANYVLHIGGEGRLLETYKSLAQELGIQGKCLFYGFLPEGKVPEFMSRLHFFVSASRAEGFGMVIAEAMACGLPVIATRSGGPDDFVVPSNGLLIPSDDIEKMTEAVQWMMANHSSYDKGVIKDFVAGRYSPEIIAARISEVYASVLKSK